MSSAIAASPGPSGKVVHSEAVHHDRSRPLRDIPPARMPRPDKHVEKRVKPLPLVAGGMFFDPVIQASRGAAAAPALGAGFDGVGEGFPNASGSVFAVNSAPPDPNGAVGANDYVEIVNTSFAVFTKAGAVRLAARPNNTLFSGFGGGCEFNNDGDATVKYDQIANRWVITQFSVTSPGSYHYLQCVAVSVTSDPTGAYYRYAFDYGTTDFPDYPKLGVWPDAYYETFNVFANGSSFSGPEVCAYDRGRMLQGLSASQQCVKLGTTYGGLLPSDLDGQRLPPAGSPNYILDFGTNQLEEWKFHVDWATPANSTLATTPTPIPVASFTPACAGGACIPQAGTSQRLDSLGDRLMYRLAYRNFGDHEALVVNQSVGTATGTGVRWYELRDPNTTPWVYQQSTYAPDGSYRWMGSAAMDKNGNLALGYSISSATMNPGLRYTGRLAGDPLGVMTQGEGTLINGTGSQTGGLNRWGDYSSLAVDPTDDCTFWYTGEYLASNGSFNWHTRIGSFQLPGCGATPPPPPASAPAAPTNLTATAGNAQVSLSWTGSSGATSYNVKRATVTGGPYTTAAGGVTSTSYTDTAVANGTTYFYVVTAVNPAESPNSNQASATPAPPPPTPDFSLSASPTSRTVSRGAGTTYTVAVSPVNGFNGSVSLSASGLPSRTSASFTPNPTTSASTLSVTTTRKTPTGTYPLTITGTNGPLLHATTVTLIVK